MGFTSGTSYSDPLAVSGDGSIVVGCVGGAGIPCVPVVWTRGSGIQPLPVFIHPNPDSWVPSIARGISDDGDAIVGTCDPGGVWVLRGAGPATTLPGDDPLISGDGLVIASANRLYPSGVLIPSLARDISHDGSVVIGSAGSTNPPPNGPFRWTPSGGIEYINGLPNGEAMKFARAVTAAGDAVVGQGREELGGGAVLWKTNGTAVQLGDLPGGGTSSNPYGISADGTIVVGASESSSGQEAFLWTNELGMVSLRDYLIDLGVTGLDGWHLTFARAISADGSTIVGVGIDPLGRDQGWIVTTPPPKCPDLTGDGFVSFVDLIAVLAYWGSASPSGDANGDESVDFDDIVYVLGNWLRECD